SPHAEERIDLILPVRGRRRSALSEFQTNLDSWTLPSNGEDFLFLRRKQLIDFRNRSVGRLLHVIGEPLLIVFGNLVILLELLDDIQPVATDMANSYLGGFGVFMRDFHQFLAPFLV